MTTSQSSAVRSSRFSSLLPWVARLLLFLLGITGLAGAIYFTFFASPAEGGVVTAFDWFVAIWKIVVCIGFMTVALAPRISQTRRLSAATWLLLSDVVFSLVKLFGYQERESLGFLAVTASVLAVVHLAHRQEHNR